MQGYIKVMYQGCTYGPIEAPTTLEIICKLVRVSMRAKPVLKSVSGQLVSLPKQYIETGLYELLANPLIEYDERIDGIIEKEEIKIIKNEMATQTMDIPTVAKEQSITFPLKNVEMKQVMDGMLHLIATIPPRYVKYNKLLSQQIDTALKQAEEWLLKLNDLYLQLENASINTKHSTGVSLGTFTTFCQYRILHLLHDVWKRVWTRFAPASRVFNVSKIYTLHSLEQAEHILNCLSSWRRMMEREDWDRIRNHGKSYQVHGQVNRVLMPPRLVGEEHAGDFVHVSQPRPVISATRDKRQDLNEFRKEYIKRISKEEVFRNKDMVRVLNDLLQEKERSGDNTSETGPFPFQFISQSIKQEFQIYC